MRLRHDPLFRLAAALGVERDKLSNVESPTRLAGTFQVSGTLIPAAVTPEALDALVAEYGDAVKLTFRVGDLDDFTFDGSYTAESHAKFVAEAGETVTYDLVLEVDKRRLVQRALDGEPACEAILYFTETAVTSTLHAGIREIEKTLWADTTRRLLILVLDKDVLISGDALSVVGGMHLEEASKEEAARPSVDAEMTTRAQRRRDDYIGWDTPFTTSLTPWHFYVERTDQSEVAEHIDATFVLLAVLFTCDRARALVATPEGQARIRAEFHGREHVAYVTIIEGDRLRDVSQEERTAINGLVDWCYQTQTGEPNSPDWLADRLPFVQMRIAQALEARPDESRFRAYATSMPEIYRGAKWQWRAFLEGRVSEYLDKVRQIEGATADTVDQYAERTTALAKSLADAMLAAVAALIGSFIAGAFAQPFDAWLFRIGLLAYAGYVALFPGLLGLLSSNGQVAETRRSFEAQRKRFDDALYKDKVSEIVGQRVTNAKTRYRRWLCGVALGYLLVAMAAAFGAYSIPHYLDSRPASTTTTIVSRR
jgi:nitroreductase